jgi:hypothetical protein
MKYKMKIKMTLLASLLIYSGLTYSQVADTQIMVGYGLQKDKTTNAEQHVQLFDLETGIIDNLKADALIINKTAEGTYSVTNREELGATVYKSFFGVITPSLRISAGDKQKSGSPTTQYYSIMPGVSAQLPYDFIFKVSYYDRQSFDQINPDTSREMWYTLGYEITKKDKVTLMMFKGMSGNNPVNTNLVSYTRKF